MRIIKRLFILLVVLMGLYFVVVKITKNSFEKKEINKESSSLKEDNKRDFLKGKAQSFSVIQKNQKKNLRKKETAQEDYVDAKKLGTKALLEKSSIFSAKSLLPALFELRSRDQIEVSKVLLDGFREASALKKGAALRERITFFAKELSYPELIPLWRDLLYRETPRFLDEQKEINKPSKIRSYARTVIHHEQRLAIEALALESTSNEIVRQELRELILGNSESVFSRSLEVRKRSFFELRKHNKSFIAQIIYDLDEKDPLKEVLIKILKREADL